MEDLLAEREREIAWLKAQLERQRETNGELRRAVADLARTFQESLAAAYDAHALEETTGVGPTTSRLRL